MSKSDHVTVVTTIQNPTSSLRNLAEMASNFEEKILVIGDKKTPAEFDLKYTQFFSVEDQKSLHFKIIEHLPYNSYTRKMLGYLEAARLGFDFIRETDDDNSPYKNFFIDFPEKILARRPKKLSLWVNPYEYFSKEKIWPRGYPIEKLDPAENRTIVNIDNVEEVEIKKIGVIQGLADGAPDVDAIYRMTVENSVDFIFEKLKPLVIPNGTFAPFNSQATIWNVKLLPIMYLPQTCTFRMTDIWRGLIANHLMHINNFELIFTEATVFQARNEHNLLKDFRDEVPGYLRNDELVETIQGIRLAGGINNLSTDLSKIYAQLIKLNFFDSIELKCLQAWIEDCEILQNGS
jgi:hypothetical protein